MAEAKGKDMPTQVTDDTPRHSDGTLRYCGEDCYYVKSLEDGMKQMLTVIKGMAAAVEKAKLTIIKLTDENIRLSNGIRDTMYIRN